MTDTHRGFSLFTSCRRTWDNFRRQSSRSLLPPRCPYASSLHCRTSYVVSCPPPTSLLVVLGFFFSSRLESFQERRSADSPRPRRVWNVGNIRRGCTDPTFIRHDRNAYLPRLSQRHRALARKIRARACHLAETRCPSTRLLVVCTSGKFDGAFARTSEIPTRGHYKFRLFRASDVFSRNSSTVIIVNPKLECQNYMCQFRLGIEINFALVWLFTQG